MNDDACGTSARRRHDAAASRQALLDAATVLFDERGYDGATVRDIGDRAGVDAALIARYFGSKEGLYLATLTQEARPPLPTDLLEALRSMLSRSDAHGAGPIPRAMVSPTLTDSMRDLLRTVIGQRVIDPLAGQLEADGVADPRLRAEILVAVAMGVSLARAGGTLPALADASLNEVIDVLAPLVEALRDGEG
jgi:AcrR family transcriptional regulator